MRWLGIFIGGGLGSMLRFWLQGVVQMATGARFPWGTFAVNASGCFAIGLLAALLEQRSLLGPTGRLFLLVGILGGYTTFSTFGLETWLLIESAEWKLALGNALGSVVVGLLAVAGGMALGRLSS